VAESTPWHDAYRQVAPDPEAWTSLALKVNQLDRAGVSFPREWLAALQIPPLLIIGDSDVVHPEHTVEMFRILGGGVPGDLVGLPPIQLAILPWHLTRRTSGPGRLALSMIIRFLTSTGATSE
jgi:hypothetical protein